MKRACVWWLSLVLLSGCGDEGGKPEGDVDSKSVPGEVEVYADEEVAPQADPPSEEEPFHADVGQEGEDVADAWFLDGADVQMADVELPGPFESGFNWPCEKDTDCMEYLCVQTADGGRCTKPCTEECDFGWICEDPGGPWQAKHGFVCLPDFLPLCRPCREPEDCWRYPQDGATTCLVGADTLEGTCVASCDSGLECPDGFLCKGGHCEPGNGLCDCDQAKSNIGYETDCLVVNEWGKCPGTRICLEDGMGPCDGPMAEQETCDGQDDDCDGSVDEDVAAQPCQATNGHGTCQGETKCIGAAHVCQAKVPAAESCNGVDDDCDGKTDEADALGCKLLHADLDGDGYGFGAPICLCQQEPGMAPQALDCDDSDASVHPGAAEPCDNQDNDCDGEKDEGCDLDGDGFCPLPIVVGPQAVCKGVDCNDFNGEIHPGAGEPCDNIDNDCDGEKDEGCDLDGDGWCGLPPASWGEGQVCLYGEIDCDDTNPLMHPTAPDPCDGIDQDCDGVADQGCDDDLDGWCEGPLPGGLALCYPKSGPAPASCKGVLATCPKGFPDCDDGKGKVHPNAVETCDNVDENCNGKADETFDLDGDGHCADPIGVMPQCGKCKGGTADCSDLLASVHPGAEDLPDLLGLDSDCDGLDGTVERTVFVDGATGLDTWGGTKSKPKRTIQAAISFAATQQDRDTVVVAVGTYKETLTFKSAVHVWGGYDPKKSWTVNPLLATMVYGGPTAATAVGISASTTVGRLDIHAGVAKEAGQSSIGLFVSKSPGLSLLDVKLQAGAGASGSPGASGASGNAGKAGSNGEDGCFMSPVPPCTTWSTDNTCPDKSAAGAEPTAKACGGRGDAIPDFTVTADELKMGFDGKDEGEPSCCWLAGADASGKGGAAGGSGQPAKQGQSGSAGKPGADGKGGSGGAISGSGWLAAPGLSGGAGMDGCGGGGGGLGGRKADAMLTCDAEGGGGGGGGSGGRGGTASEKGGGGGGSIALLLHKSSIQVVACKLNSSNGGQGGNGGNGAAGGAGGKGGSGAGGYKGSGKGGDGGNGGKGGNGGAAGGGAGGASAALAHDASSKPTLTTVTLTAGKGGSGGLAGKHPDGTFAAGNGMPGASGKIVVF